MPETLRGTPAKGKAPRPFRGCEAFLLRWLPEDYGVAAAVVGAASLGSPFWMTAKLMFP